MQSDCYPSLSQEISQKVVGKLKFQHRPLYPVNLHTKADDTFTYTSGRYVRRGLSKIFFELQERKDKFRKIWNRNLENLLTYIKV